MIKIIKNNKISILFFLIHGKEKKAKKKKCMHPALIFFIILIVLTVVIAIGYFGYKHFHISEECSLLGDTLEFLELYNPASFDDKEIKIFEKMTPNERKQKLEDLRKKMAENKANNLANNIR